MASVAPTAHAVDLALDGIEARALAEAWGPEDGAKAALVLASRPELAREVMLQPACENAVRYSLARRFPDTLGLLGRAAAFRALCRREPNVPVDMWPWATLPELDPALLSEVQRAATEEGSVGRTRDAHVEKAEFQARWNDVARRTELAACRATREHAYRALVLGVLCPLMKTADARVGEVGELLARVTAHLALPQACVDHVRRVLKSRRTAFSFSETFEKVLALLRE